jgi:hypothetical protein
MVMNRSYALAREEIIRALVAYTGVTTADGAVTRDSLIDSNLIGATDWITGKTILIDSGDSERQDKGATSFNPVTGEISVVSAFTNRIMAGTMYRILNIASTELEVALLLARVGTNVDPAGTDTLFAWFARLWAALAAISVDIPLCYSGTVTAIPGPNEFTIPTLAGKGAGKFLDLSGVAPYYAFVFRDAGGGGAAPQNESQPVTNYATLTGSFMTAAFSAPVDIGDEILIIHPFLARIMNLYGLPPAVGTVTGNWQTAEADLVTIGAPNTKYKLHSLMVGIQNLVGNISIRLYINVAGTERRIYPIPAAMTFNVATDGPAIPVVMGTLGIHNALRVTMQSDNAADNGQGVDYDYMLEAM